MKIALVCGHFVPEIGYIEVYLAKALHRLGHKVKVITSTEVSFSSKHLGLKYNKEEYHLGFEVKRLKPLFAHNQIVISKGIAKEIDQFSPDKVMVIGLGKIFPKEVFQIKNKDFKLITILGDNEESYYEPKYNIFREIKRYILKKVLKIPVYKLAIEHSDELIGYTSSTQKIVNSFIKDKFKVMLDAKFRSSSLGFDETEFYYSEKSRDIIRKKLNIKKNDFVLITITRVVAIKKLDEIIKVVEGFINKGIEIKYVIAGFTDNEYGKQLKEYIRDQNMQDYILTLPFISKQEMMAYYNMADIGLWTRSTISLFEALGTGLFLLLPDQPNVNHVLNEETGNYYLLNNLHEILENSINKVKLSQNDRVVIAERAKDQFSFLTIANNIIKD